MRANGKSYNDLPDLPPPAAAGAAGLRYVSDASPGIVRVRSSSGGFRYARRNGRRVRDGATLERIRKLAIPPAWSEVWICAREDGHLQATGRDARGRKQYRYHARWREVRDEAKYGRLLGFAYALPRIRRNVRRHLALPGLNREKALAAVVRLLETTLIRVGNEEYARENRSYGLTTLRDGQVRVDGAKLSFRFRGKSGVAHSVALTDRRLAAIVKRMRELPGQTLFQYVDEKGVRRSIDSGDVNDYLRAVSGEALTSKDFRTWAATLLCARALLAIEPPPSKRVAKRKVAQAVEAVARKLGNTVSVCRKCYIHPAVIERYVDGTLTQALRGATEEAALASLLAAHGNGTPIAPQGDAIDRRAHPGVFSRDRERRVGGRSGGAAKSWTGTGMGSGAGSPSSPGTAGPAGAR